MKDLVSVIIPSFNHSRFLKQRLESVFNQTYNHIEVIILDDASSDDSMSIFEEWKLNPRLRLLEQNETNSGSAFHQWKKGVDLAKGEYIWIAESDDYSNLDFLEKSVRYLSENNCGLVYCQTNDVDDNGQLIANRISYTYEFSPNIWQNNFTINGTELIKTYFKTKNVIPNASAVVVRKNYLQSAIEAFPDVIHMKYAGDWLIWIQIAENCRVGFIAETMNNFRNHSGITRVHPTREKLHKRLSEEKSVRAFLAKKYPEINQSREWYKLSEWWFPQLRGVSKFSKQFYEFKPPFETRWTFIKRFNNYLSSTKWL